MSWLGIRRSWRHVRFEGGGVGRALLLPHRSKRVPWLPPLQTHMLVAINDSQDLLLIYRNDRFPEEPLEVDAALVQLSPAMLCLSRISEFYEWPLSEAIFSEFSGLDLASVDDKSKLADDCLRQWNRAPVKGWCPVHRGIAGLSIMRNVVALGNRQCCLEIQASDLNLYRGTIEENAGLLDSRILQSWRIHKLNSDSLKNVVPDDIRGDSRIIMRRYRQFIYDYALRNELPF